MANQNYTLSYEYVTTPAQGYAVSGFTASEAVDVVIPDTYNGNNGELPVIAIKDSVFEYNINVRTLKLSNNLLTIGNGAFTRCIRFNRLIIPNSVTTIGDYAFYDTLITDLVIGSGVTSIGIGAFQLCASLKNITMLSTPPVISSDAFDGISSNAKFYCLSSMLSSYESASNWYGYFSKFVSDDLRIYFLMNSVSNKSYIEKELSYKQDIIQYATMPTAESSNVGKIVQYIGATNSTYTNGYFYKCVDLFFDNYSWAEIKLGSQVSVSASGTSNTEVKYITVDGTESKLPNTEVVDTTGGNIQSAPVIVPSLSIVEDSSTTISISSVKANTMYKCTGNVTSFSAAFDSSFPDGGFAEFIFNGTASMTVDFTVPSGMSVTALDTTFGADTNYCIMAQRQGDFIWLVEMDRELPATNP